MAGPHVTEPTTRGVNVEDLERGGGRFFLGGGAGERSTMTRWISKEHIRPTLVVVL